MHIAVAAANVEDGLSAGLSTQRKALRRPWLCFVLLVLMLVMAFAAGGPIYAQLHPVRGALARRRRAHEGVPRLNVVSHSQPGVTSSPPPPPPPPPPRALSDPGRSVDAKGALDPGGAPRVSERSPLIQAMIEAGFSREQAAAALGAIGAKAVSDVPRAIEWALKQGTDRNLAEFNAEREVHTFSRIDFDGYAVMWGDKHRARSLDECGRRCAEWKPRPPSNFACNVFVFCPLEKCYAPAALPPGSMTGQCWLKHQDDPNNPQVNMKGNYSAAYIKRHPGAPAHVQWDAGVVVRKGSRVDTSTWSSRANW